MFDQLSDRLRSALDPLGGRGRITEEDVDQAMREVRLALLEADVNFKVVKQFTEGVRGRCLEADVTSSVDPGQQVIKIVNDELTELMGGSGRELALAGDGMTVILLAGLQGAGKTTAAAKLAENKCDPHAVDLFYAATEAAWMGDAVAADAAPAHSVMKSKASDPSTSARPLGPRP